MDINVVDPALREVARKSVTLNLENPLTLRTVGTLSRFVPGKRLDGVTRRVVKDGEARVRVYIPEQSTGSGLLWVHGGGLVLGSAAVDDRMCAETAREVGVVVVSVDYRLAPRHRFPTAIDDCDAGFAWFRAHAAALGVDPERIAIGGQSAGGGLAACLAQRLVDQRVPVVAEWLFCPMLDDRTAMNRDLDAANHFIWNNRANLVGWRSYLGDQVGASDLPAYASAARRESLAGLPPTWLYTSTIELFHDEDIDYAHRLEAAGVPVTLDVVDGAPHAFEAWAPDTEPALALKARARAWLRAQLG